jgi:hypothetical protein
MQLKHNMHDKLRLSFTSKKLSQKKKFQVCTLTFSTWGYFLNKDYFLSIFFLSQNCCVDEENNFLMEPYRTIHFQGNHMVLEPLNTTS